MGVNGVCIQRVGDGEGKTVVTAFMGADPHTIHIHVSLPIHSAKMQQDLVQSRGGGSEVTGGGESG